ncbi:MAG: flagellar basal body P-ring protein FlgI [Chlamydiia bacterium]|nr:flagellar basal body P-ring protein FlgI [Chlamydiia bacterium]
MCRIVNTLLALCLLAPSLHAAAKQDFMVEDIWAEYEERMSQVREKIPPGRQIKVRDLVNISGEEAVKLTGFGVVTGLQGSGDSGEAAIKMLLTVAEKQGIRLTLDDVSARNVALVSISGEVNPHQRTFDVAVKSVGDSKSLQNGFLEGSTLYPLGGSEVFAVASGAVALGARYYEAASAGVGASAGISSSSSVTIGHPTTGFVIDGGQMVKEIPSMRIQNGSISLNLKHPNERTATNVANAVNEYMGDIGLHALPTSASVVRINLEDPLYASAGDVTRLIADIGDLPTHVSRRAMITIDQGSGVIAMTEGVKMEPGSIAVAGLTVTVSSDITPVTRQGVYEGETAFFDVPELEVSQDQANFLTLPAGTDLRQVQESLNALKLTPTSIISVFNAMHKAGMIHADIVVIPR